MKQKNNVIVLLIDSIFSECLGDRKTAISATPFIDSLKENAIFAPNLYSYGPFTDVASKALYCSTKPLDSYGYYFGLNSTENNHFKLFKENGYKTVGLYYPYYLLGSEIEKHIDHPIYTGGFKYSSVWGGKLEYYAKKKAKGELSDKEYALMEECMELVFGCWISFYNDIESKKCSGQIVTRFKTRDADYNGKEHLLKQYDEFRQEPKKYIDGLLEKGMDHPIAQINEYDFGTNDNIEFIKSVFENNKAFFKEANKTNFRRNLFNTDFSIKEFFKNIFGYATGRDRDQLRYIVNYGMLLRYGSLMKKRALKSGWQNIASLNSQITALLNTIDSDNESKPFYASLHTLEPHHNISFFSFDSFDGELVKEELEYLSPLVKECGKKFSGNLMYMLSLRYVDFYVKKLYSELEKRGILDNTTIVLVSDHGTSYFSSPVRNSVVNTFYKENYNIPLLIWGKNIDKDLIGQYNGLYSSDDVMPTLCDVLRIERPSSFSGVSLLEDSGRKWVISEYMGGGVPDMLEREVWLCIRNGKYSVAYKNSIAKEFDVDKPFCVFDLEKDKLERHNLAGKTKDDDMLVAMKKAVNERCVEIQKETTAFLKKQL